MKAYWWVLVGMKTSYGQNAAIKEDSQIGCL